VAQLAVQVISLKKHPQLAEQLVVQEISNYLSLHSQGEILPENIFLIKFMVCCEV
jgi:hypothetical protein